MLNLATHQSMLTKTPLPAYQAWDKSLPESQVSMTALLEVFDNGFLADSYNIRVQSIRRLQNASYVIIS